MEAAHQPIAATAPAARRPFWRLPRFGGRDAAETSGAGVAAASATATAVNASTAASVADSTAVEAATDTSAAADPAPATGATPVSLVDAVTTPAEKPVAKPATTTPRIAPVLRKPLPPRTGATIVSDSAPVEIAVNGLNKRFGQNVAVAGVDLEVRSGSFYGIVGPNGAGKTTTLSMITGLLRPDSGSIHVHGIDVWADPVAAKRAIGVLPDRLRLFDRLTGAQLLYYAGVLRGLESETVRTRSADLAAAFGLEGALNRLVADYSAGMTKKIALACAMIHSPRVLVLDEPFESVDPVSAVNVTEILQRYVAAGGTVILSSHGMDLIQRVCDHVAIIVQGSVLASGTIDEVRGNVSLEERFVDLAGGRKVAEGLEWLHNFSD
ncbi:ABC transporter ATP-binding protein [Cryobacterium sp. PAMC25264]|nr:ABC transporter ATP-binding protein [Cryobacterium sp. PAMC25264]